ncbi:hypothetical protein LCGC14_2854640 [marine sediment metagenome]|uniref:Uncharacterized protein n=1 Tax=marine sediment metagenome TaxID=412755 RepID=A0A0F9AYB0_9ZZZZ
MRVRRKWPKRRRCPTCGILISGEGLTQYWRRCYWDEILPTEDFAYAVRLAWVLPYTTGLAIGVNLEGLYAQPA